MATHPQDRYFDLAVYRCPSIVSPLNHPEHEKFKNDEGSTDGFEFRLDEKWNGSPIIKTILSDQHGHCSEIWPENFARYSMNGGDAQYQHAVFGTIAKWPKGTTLSLGMLVKTAF